MDCATLYVIDTSLIGSKVLDTLPHVVSYEFKSDGKNASGMIIKLEKATIDCNFTIGIELDSHLDGLTGFVNANIKEKVDLCYVLTRIHFVQLAIGCVIEPGFDDRGEVLDCIQHYNKALNAMLFHESKLFDYDLEILAGYD